MADTRIIQRGVAKIETVAGALDAFVQINIQSVKGKHVWDSVAIKDFAGFEYGWSGRNAHIITSINFNLTGSSFAVAAQNGLFLAEFAALALSGFDLAWLNATGYGGFYTGNWCYHEGGSIDLSNERPGGHEISIRKFKDPTQNSAQFVIPT